MWLGAEWLYWTTSGNQLPPLVRSAPPGTPFPVAGTLGSPGQTVTGGRDYNDEWRNGFRVYGGLWLGSCQRVGVEGDFFFLGESRTREAVGADGSQILARPFLSTVRRNDNGTFNPVVPFAASEYVSRPGVVAGTATVNTASDFTGAGANLVRNLLCNECGRLDFLVGYRYLNLNDTLFIREDLRTLTQSQFPAGTRFEVEDRFRTENHFHGVPVGLAWERRAGNLFLSLRGTVALGVTRTIADIDGATTITDPNGNRQRFTGGLLAQPSNIGRHVRDTFAVVPEVGGRVGVQLTGNVRVYGGYNFIYWSSVTRTGDVIDLRVNPSQLPQNGPVTGPLFPRFEPRTSDSFIHGAVAGVQVRF
jgi:hypothetical protein